MFPRVEGKGGPCPLLNPLSRLPTSNLRDALPGEPEGRQPVHVAYGGQPDDRPATRVMRIVFGRPPRPARVAE